MKPDDTLRSRRRLAAVMILIALSATACRSAVADVAEPVEPFALEPIEGTDVSRLILTQDAIQRIALETAPIVADRSVLLIPASAVWIDVDGVSWIYTNPEPRTFVRAEVVVARYDRHTAVLSEGPPAGVAIVTVGVAELIGSEFGI